MSSIDIEPGIYYKKVSVDDDEQKWVDTSISSVYTDLFDGKTTTAKIQGGGDHQMYLSEIVIPEADDFGDSELVGLKYLLHPTTVSLQNTNSYPPEFKLWKLNKSMGNNEGTITPDVRNLAVFTSRIDAGVPYLSDDFSAGIRKTDTVRGKTILKSEEPFITPETAEKLQQPRGLNGFNAPRMTAQEISDKYGSDFGGDRVIYIEMEWKIRNQTLGTWNVATSRIDSILNFVNDPSWENAVGAASGGRLEYMWVPMNGATWGWDVAWSDYEVQDHIKYTKEIEDSREIAIPADASETIFTDFYSRGDGKRDAEGNLLMEARASFNNDKFLSGAQSLTLSTTWNSMCAPGEENYAKIAAPNARNSGATNRQEVVAMMELPAPQPIDAVGSSSRDSEDYFKPEGRTPSSDLYATRGLTGQFFTMDFNVEEMAYMYHAGEPHQDGGTNGVGAFDNTACLRGMAVCFSVTKPLENESFYDFTQRCTAETDYWIQGSTEYPEYNEWGTFFGLWIGKFNWDGTSTFSYNNLNQEKYSDDPLLVCPSGYQAYQDEGSGGTGAKYYGWRTCNMAHHTSGGDPDRFHETVGPSVFVTPGKNTAGAFDDEDISSDCCELDENVWYKMSVFFPPEEDKVPYLTFYDSQGKRKTKDIQLNSAKFSGAQKDHHPKYISIWLVNYPGSRTIEGGGETPFDLTGGPDAWTTSSKVHIDNVALSGFGSVIENASVNDNNMSIRSNIKMGPTSTFTSDIGTSYNLSDGLWQHGKGMEEPVQNSTYISIGFDDAGDFDKNSGLSNGTYLLFNGMSVNSSAYEALHHSDSDRYLRLGFTSNQKREQLGHQNSHHFFEHDSSTASRKLRGLSMIGASAKGFDLTGNSAVENFNQKGMVHLNFNSTAHNRGTQYDGATQCTSERRENIFASARVLTVADAKDGWVGVDNPSIFNLPDDQEYVIFRRDTRFEANHFFNTDWDSEPTSEHSLVVKVLERSGNLIKFNKDVRFTTYQHQKFASGTGWDKDTILLLDSLYFNSRTLCTENSKSHVWISPLKYWLVMEIFNNSGTGGQPGVSRQYGSICSVNKAEAAFPTSSVYGTTYNETKFTDTALSTNAWNLTPTSESKTVETQVDFGNGTMSEENPEGGFVDKFLAKDADTKIVIDADNMIKEGKIKSGDSVTTLVSASNAFNTTSVTVGTGENTTTKYKPFALGKFKDEIPKIENFDVSPDENNPYYPRFTWNCKDEDAWYGFIILDKKIPKHQYHESYCYVPMNRPLPSTDNQTILWPPDITVDTKSDIFDYVNENHNTYGYVKLNKKIGEHYKFSSSATNPKMPSASVADEFAFLDPEGLNGWCHNFASTDSLYVDVLSGSDSTIIGDVFSCSVIVRPSALPSISEASIFETASGRKGIKLYIDSDGYVYARVFYSRSDGGTGKVILQSHSKLVTDGTPTNIIVTFDKYLKHGNLKLFIDSKLEDVSGRAYIGSSPSSSNTTNWEWNRPIYKLAENLDRLLIGDGYQYGSYEGRMEELVFYQNTIYPIVPNAGEFVLETPLEESDSDGKPINYTAKIFIKDYHNIRGKTKREVATAPHINLHKVGLGK